jgi:hypothetical protein
MGHTRPLRPHLFTSRCPIGDSGESERACGAAAGHREGFRHNAKADDAKEMGPCADSGRDRLIRVQVAARAVTRAR